MKRRKTYTPDELEAMSLNDMTMLRNGAIYSGNSKLARILTDVIQSKGSRYDYAQFHSKIVATGGGSGDPDWDGLM